MTDGLREGLGVLRQDLDVFGGDLVGEFGGVADIVDDDDRAIFLPAFAGDVFPREVVELAFDGVGDFLREGFVISDEDALCALIVLGLAEEIGGDPCGVILLVGDDEDFGRSGDHIYADIAEHLSFGFGDIGVARAGNFIDRRDGGGAVGESGDGRCAAHAPDFVDSGAQQRGHEQGVEGCIGRRGGGDALDACELGGDCVHEHGGGITSMAAGDIKPDRVQRLPPPAQLDFLFVGEVEIFGPLFGMPGFDACCGEIEGIARILGAVGGDFFNFVAGEAQSVGSYFGIVEFLR